jgi:hypothetical protein
MKFVDLQTFRVTAVLKFDTNIITSIAADPIELAVMLVIMHVEIFKTDVTVFIGNVVMCLTSN